jgi:hypothetical protein
LWKERDEKDEVILIDWSWKFIVELIFCYRMVGFFGEQVTEVK